MGGGGASAELEIPLPRKEMGDFRIRDEIRDEMLEIHPVWRLMGLGIRSPIRFVDLFVYCVNKRIYIYIYTVYICIVDVYIYTVSMRVSQERFLSCVPNVFLMCS
jgi:hypothetical protein